MGNPVTSVANESGALAVQAGTVYVVLRQTGEYSDAFFTPVGVYLTEGAAQAFCDGAAAQRDAAFSAHPNPNHPTRWDRPIGTPKDDEDRARARDWKLASEGRKAMMTLDPNCGEDSSWEVIPAPLVTA